VIVSGLQGLELLYLATFDEQEDFEYVHIVGLYKNFERIVQVTR
jgi:hypothetical protein